MGALFHLSDRALEVEVNWIGVDESLQPEMVSSSYHHWYHNHGDHIFFLVFKSDYGTFQVMPIRIAETRT